ncbi:MULTISPECIES: AzlC family ABC transporter permease [unclassified Halomonas]|uniref:AzlC family ABC transporter permease n=1 Tax=unclassified Halomonas TaxID=2609666 RepID=UPI00209FD977|nr:MULTISPECIES: AzlC family ABC transporter permease [unclassified Halomonas]MCP1314378.1 AzlC family ABC transporter permease [Halomonas sp. 707D7]MCP1328619.1 AzlC family ABC transporter permease [Halomonas sp. 707D4]
MSHRHARINAALRGARDGIPLLGGYVPVSLSFGLVATQAGFSPWEAAVISALIYAGASQFLFVGMVAAGAPLWLVVALTLLINVRHVVYGPNLATLLPRSRHWPWLMHGLTDQVFALALTRLPEVDERERFGWFLGAALMAWAVWIVGTVVGAVAGEAVTAYWPLLGDIMPFALPALFLTMTAPRFTNRRWSAALTVTVLAAMALSLSGATNVAIPLAAACGALCFYTLRFPAGRCA